MNIIIRSESLPGRGGRRSEGGRLGNKTPRRSWPSSCKEAGCHASTEGPSLCHLSKYSRSSNATEPSAGFREAGSRTRLQVPGIHPCRRKKAAPEQPRHRGRSFSCFKYKNSSSFLESSLSLVKKRFFLLFDWLIIQL